MGLVKDKDVLTAATLPTIEEEEPLDDTWEKLLINHA